MDTKVEWIINQVHTYLTTIRVRRTSRKKRIRGRPKRRGRRLTCHAVMVFAATSKSSSIVTFDTDSGEVGIDNRASGCFSHVIGDFVGPMRDCHRVVKGFGGSRTSNVKMGTMKWSWEDDNGMKSTHLIPNSYYSKEWGVRLLSPQHFAQVASNRNGTWGSRTTAKTITLMWGKQSVRTVPLDRRSNVATFHLSPGHDKFNAFCLQTEVTPDQDKSPIPTKWQREQLDHRNEVRASLPTRKWESTTRDILGG